VIHRQIGERVVRAPEELSVDVDGESSQGTELRYSVAAVPLTLMVPRLAEGRETER
jgi:hypothetical protein